MKMMFNAFGKRLFGVRYERLIRSIFLVGIIYYGLRSAGYSVPIAPSIFFVISFAVTAGVMWNSLNSNDSIEMFKNMLMMPFDDKKLIFAYVTTLGIHAILMNTLIIWGVILAVTTFGIPVILGGIASAILSIMICTIVFVGRRKLNGYVFYDIAVENEKHGNKVKSHKNNLVWTYLTRYMLSHKNYITNSIVAWVVAGVYPFFITILNDNSSFYEMLMYVGFGVVAINTPLCVLVSCDPDLDRGIKCLPGAVNAFFVPYGAFIFLNTCISYVIYLISWGIKGSEINAMIIVVAVILAMIGAVLSVVLEYFFPVKNWKVESDLLHNPRKYVVPGIVIILAGLAQTIVR